MTSTAESGAELNPDMPEVGINEITVGELTGDEPTAYAEAADHSIAVEDFGTTEAEMAAGESLDGRLAREEPEVGYADPITPAGQPEFDPSEGDPGEGDPTALTGNDDDPDDYLVGRLVAPDEGAHSDTTKEEIGSDLGSDGGGFSAEEAAMHIDPNS